MARQISTRGVPFSMCRITTLRKLVSGSCSDTRLTHLMPRPSRKPCSSSGSSDTRLIRLDSLGVTWLMIEVRIGVAPPRDRGHLHIGVVFLQIHVAVGFAERRFGFQPFGVDIAFDDDFGFRGNQQIDRDRLHHIDRRTDQPAGDFQLVEGFGNFLRRDEGDRGRRAEHHRGRHFFAALFVFQPMRVDAGPQLQRRIHAEAARGFSPGRDNCPCSGRRCPGLW